MNTNPICNSLIALPRQVNFSHVTTPFRKTTKNRNITSTFKLAKDAHLRRQRDLLGELLVLAVERLEGAQEDRHVRRLHCAELRLRL